MSDVRTLPLRAEVPVEQTWDLESVYASPVEWGPRSGTLTSPEPVEAAFGVLAKYVERLELLVG